MSSTVFAVAVSIPKPLSGRGVFLCVCVYNVSMHLNVMYMPLFLLFGSCFGISFRMHMASSAPPNLSVFMQESRAREAASMHPMYICEAGNRATLACRCATISQIDWLRGSEDEISEMHDSSVRDNPWEKPSTSSAWLLPMAQTQATVFKHFA